MRNFFIVCICFVALVIVTQVRWPENHRASLWATNSDSTVVYLYSRAYDMCRNLPAEELAERVKWCEVKSDAFVELRRRGFNP
jgi:hypothetical protein